MAPPLILHVITGLGSGGAERMLSRLVQADSVPGLAVRHHVVSLTDEGFFGAAIRNAGIPLTCLGMRGFGSLPSAVLQLRRLIRELQPGLVQTWLYHADLVGLAAARLVGDVPVAWNLRCSDMALGFGATGLLRRLNARLSQLPVAILSNAEANRDVHAGLGYKPRRWEIVPNGFEVSRFKPDLRTKVQVRHRLGLGDGPVLIQVARLDPMKDHPTALAAYRKIVEARPDVSIMLVGRGIGWENAPFRERRGDRALFDRLWLLGERDDIPDLLAAADFGLLTSAYGEGFPNVVGEAMAAGVPMVVTDVGDAAEVVGATGSVVLPGDPEKMADAVLELIGESNSLATRRKEAARRRVLQNFTIEQVTRRYAELWHSLIATRQSAPVE